MSTLDHDLTVGVSVVDLLNFGSYNELPGKEIKVQMDDVTVLMDQPAKNTGTDKEKVL